MFNISEKYRIEHLLQNYIFYLSGAHSFIFFGMVAQKSYNKQIKGGVKL